MEQEHRRFRRMKFEAPGELSHQGLNYQVHVLNLSLRGALVSSDEPILVPEGDHCTLSFQPEGAPAPIVLTAEVKHGFFSMLGVQFLSYQEGAEARLIEVLRSLPEDTGTPASAPFAKVKMPGEPQFQMTRSAPATPADRGEQPRPWGASRP